MDIRHLSVGGDSNAARGAQPIMRGQSALLESVAAIRMIGCILSPVASPAAA
jgi:hypothetical protein